MTGEGKTAFVFRDSVLNILTSFQTLAGNREL